MSDLKERAKRTAIAIYTVADGHVAGDVAELINLLLAELEKAKSVIALGRSRCQEIITKSDNREDNIIYIQNALSQYKEGE